MYRKPLTFEGETRYTVSLTGTMLGGVKAWGIYDRTKRDKRQKPSKTPVLLCQSSHLAVWVTNLLNETEHKMPGHRWVGMTESQILEEEENERIDENSIDNGVNTTP